jgi:hypothetical protein
MQMNLRGNIKHLFNKDNTSEIRKSSEKNKNSHLPNNIKKSEAIKEESQQTTKVNTKTKVV